ncbi:hypothetical protein ACPCIR_25740 [Mycobacterium sp. NPDC051198]
MTRKALFRSTVAVIGIVAAISGGYLYWQYRTAAPPRLEKLRTYSERYEVPLTDIPEPDRSARQAALTTHADSAQVGYRIAAQRFLATKGPLTWDAIRSSIGSELSPSGYTIVDDGISADSAISYTLYGHEGLRQKFNNDMILISGFTDETNGIPMDDQVHMYAYFRLAPT